MRRTLIASGTLTVWLAAAGSPVIAAQTDAQIVSPAHTIHIKNFKFEPTPIKIHSGDRVTFVNDDSEAHTATADDKSFDSEALDTDGTWQHAFTKPGTYNYFCELHPYMKATIVVLPAASGAR